MKVNLAERAGFEPARPFLEAYSLSRGALSATPPPLLQECLVRINQNRIQVSVGRSGKSTEYFLEGVGKGQK